MPAVHHAAVGERGRLRREVRLLGRAEVLQLVDGVERDVVVRHEDLLRTRSDGYVVDFIEAHHAAVAQHHRRMVHEAGALEAVQLPVLAQEVRELRRKNVVVPLQIDDSPRGATSLNITLCDEDEEPLSAYGGRW